ncbi:uncharacterized protein L969DRAFT_96141 [Mixia osmundae IAM 14324]|uniref:ER transporter 6TM N-terminal domain-containing protein n=1 Tax=Mixia osmundae (strain CBS 9802 / IAM 14324 / JCM 22182 / KY 12970) TaxID=764103 RepID=G7EA57_MIXOS|nr:uncharacterized protein L969DRAFT_96141 [Mixia osmundae IAM 14324]KEI37615.1 hypothetical protein L969DRAFT_96141 [Mixia osmundae IAM 14324]GAA99717.1 hypothetical protein E5Q_06420 [Mixia osmundae IAM 14324]
MTTDNKADDIPLDDVGDNQNNPEAEKSKRSGSDSSTAISASKAAEAELTAEPARSSDRPSAFRSVLQRIDSVLPPWLAPHLQSSQDWKILFRCGVSLWLSMLFTLVSDTEHAAGRAAFLFMIVAVIVPPSDPVSLTFRKTFIYGFMVAAAWAYCVVGVRIAWIARKDFKYTQAEFTQMQAARFARQGLPAAEIPGAIGIAVINGEFIETNSSIVIAVWLSVGMATLMWIKGRIGPSPLLFGVILSMILISIVCTLAHLYPYPDYLLGQTFYIPFIWQSAVTLACSAFIFPEQLGAHTLRRIGAALIPIRAIAADQSAMLATSPLSAEWDIYKRNEGRMAQSGQALMMLNAVESYVRRDIAWMRMSQKDVSKILMHLRFLSARAASFVFFQSMISSRFDRHPNESAKRDRKVATEDNFMLHLPKERGVTLDDSKEEAGDTHSGTSSPVRQDTAQSASTFDTLGNQNDAQGRQQRHVNPKLHIPSGARKGSPHEPKEHKLKHRPVGLFESAQYHLLAERISNSDDERAVVEVVALLHSSSADLLHATVDAMDSLLALLSRGSGSGLSDIFRDSEQVWGPVTERSDALARLDSAIADYRNKKRLEIIRPFAPLFDSTLARDGRVRQPSHRALFWSMQYQWALIQFSDKVRALVSEVVDIQKRSPKKRLWAPLDWPFAGLFSSHGETGENYGEYDPDVIEGLSDFGYTSARDPEVILGGHTMRFGNLLHQAGNLIKRSDVLFAIKSAILIALLSLPCYLRSSAHFFYTARGIWAVLMVGLASVEFVGQTVSNFFYRIICTVIGALFGLVIWYITAGNGDGNAYALAAVWAVLVLPIMMIRLYYPALINGVIAVVTAILVFGYSWQDTHFPSAGQETGHGWETAWKRCVLVIVGVTAAFIAAFLPPSTSDKTSLRITHARSLQSTGVLFCQIISFANVKQGPSNPVPKSIAKNWLALRTRLRMTAMHLPFVGYEYNLRGRWPKERYQRLLTLQLEMVDILAQLASVIAELDSDWTQALLSRTRLGEPEFIGELEGALYMAHVALRHATPLPRYWTPLATRLTDHRYGVNLVLEDEMGSNVPHTVNMDVASSENYLKFCTATTLAWNFINRVDRIVYTVKELVGEDFALHLRDDASSSKEQLLQSHSPDGFPETRI